MLVVATCFWTKNEFTSPSSGEYTPDWVIKLRNAFDRHLTVPFQFVCFVDRYYAELASHPIKQMPLSIDKPQFTNFTEPYSLNLPMILVGLDTLIIDNVNHFAHWCMNGDRIALVRDARHPDQSINGVALVPGGWKRVYDDWDGQQNDMEHLRKYPFEPICDRWPGQVVSYKMHCRPRWGGEPPAGTRIVYFHGQPKMDTLNQVQFIRDHWR